MRNRFIMVDQVSGKQKIKELIEINLNRITIRRFLWLLIKH